MKNLIFIICLLLSTTFVSVAQDDNYGGCMEFFPNKEGAILISKNYDAANKLLSTMTYRVNKVYGYESGDELIIGFTMTDGKDKVIDQGEIIARCDGGTFYMNMSNRALTPDVMKMLGSDTELVGDFLDYPDMFTDLEAYDGKLAMTGGEYTVQSKKDKKNFISVRVYDRMFEKNEDVTTPAGTFHAAKISFNFESYQNKKSTRYKGVEWYAPNAGIIRSETYDKNGKLQNYTVLTTLQNNK